ncbi:Isoflavone reductase-like protein [Fusarium oxysporum f. sp. albedinis]|nr:Isoflavone reductase-like protein [Fusarium oxysporum f. sp. albedinis]
MRSSDNGSDWPDLSARSLAPREYPLITQLPSDKCPAPRTRISRRLGAKSMQFQGWRTATLWLSVWFKSDVV